MGNGRSFDRYIGIDYSGAGLPTRSMAELAVCTVDGDGCEVFPPPLRRGPDNRGPENWNREDIAKWLVDRLKEQETPTLVGIDHAFSFPVAYFRLHPHLLGGDWGDFLDDFRNYWPTHGRGVTVRSQYIRQVRRMMEIEEGGYRFGLPNWFRLTDPKGASACFDFMVKRGEVATSTHAGLPWLRYIRRKLKQAGAQVHFWPFDGWTICEGRSVVVEAYPRIWKRDVVSKGSTDHQKDAYVIARWMWEANKDDRLKECFIPHLNEAEFNQARKEGWIFGAMDPTYRDGG